MTSESPARPPASPRRRLLRRLAGICLSIAIFLLLLEVILAAAPGLLPPSLGNAVYGRYNAHPWGMYFALPGYPMLFLRPHHDLIAYWNGYTWHHHTDARGFRNPDSWAEPSILLLGDSMIYGHGVEVEDTVGFVLHEEMGRPVYNMARQGDCLYQQYVLLRLYAAELKPRTVVLFVFLNDFADLLYYRTPEDLEDPPEIERYDYTALRQLVEAGTGGPQTWSERTYLRLRSLRLLGTLARQAFTAEAATRNTRSLLPLNGPQRRLTASYAQQILADLRTRLEAQGTDLLVVHLFIDPRMVGFHDTQRAMNRALRAICQEEGLRCTATHELFKGCPECFLTRDGHFSPEGHRRLAHFVDAALDPSGAVLIPPFSAVPAAGAPAGSAPPPPPAASSSPPRNRSGTP